MRRLSALIAIFAAIMLVIGGEPTLASANPCNPCPPDCAMMKMAQMADHHGKAPDQQDRGDNPCKGSAACQAVIALPTLPQTTEIVWVRPKVSVHPIRYDRVAPSRPPDRNLRPPIQL